jgi:hypothetical protein
MTIPDKMKPFDRRPGCRGILCRAHGTGGQAAFAVARLTLILCCDRRRRVPGMACSLQRPRGPPSQA